MEIQQDTVISDHFVFIRLQRQDIKTNEFPYDLE